MINSDTFAYPPTPIFRCFVGLDPFPRPNGQLLRIYLESLCVGVVNFGTNFSAPTRLQTSAGKLLLVLRNIWDLVIWTSWGRLDKGEEFYTREWSYKNPLPLLYFSSLLFYIHTFGFSSLFLWPTCFSGTKFLSQQSFKLGSKTHARQSPFTPAVQRAMQWSNPYHRVFLIYIS